MRIITIAAAWMLANKSVVEGGIGLLRRIESP
jgi:hypothetical protein